MQHTAIPDDVDIVVLGAGISGLVGASVLLRQGWGSVLVVDEYDRVGGNHIDVAIGDYTFDIGSLIFQDDSPLLDHFPGLLPHYQPIDPSWSRINPEGLVTEYPFSLRDDVLAQSRADLARTAASAVTGRLDRRAMRTAHDYARRAVGERFLRESGLEHYMERLCGCPIDEIELAFAESRMAWVADQTRPGAVADRLWRTVRPVPPRPATNRQLARPRDGFAALYRHAQDDLTARGACFALGRRLRAVRRTHAGMEVETDAGTIRATRVVSTIPVQRSMDLVGLAVPPLPTVTLVSLFYSFAGDRGFDDPILYNFTHRARWKRMTVYSDFYGAVDGRQYFTVEVVRSPGEDVDTAGADVELRGHLADLGLLEGDLRLEGHHVLDNAYPVYTRGSGDRAAATRARLARAGVDSFGRQGGFQYQPTARASTIEAEIALGSPREEPA